MNFSDIILIIIAFLASYTYITYPVILFILSKLYDNPTTVTDPYYPEITVVISAYNEEEFIEKTINSICDSYYPSEKIKIIVGSDGSTDKTNEIVERLAKKDERISLLALNRMGKNQVINNIIPLVKTDYVVMMDADIVIRRFALRNLLNRITDPSVGCVIAAYDREDLGHNLSTGSEGSSLYIRFEEKLRYYESKISSNINAIGALYCFKRELFKEIINNNVCDDLYIVFSIIESKQRVLFSTYARCYEIRSHNLGNEFNRRVRLLAGGLSTIYEFKNLLNIFKYGIDSFFIWSHKVFRWISPILLLLLAIATIFADYNSPIFKFVFISQLVVYGFAILGWIFEKIGIKLKLFKLPLFFISMNISSMFGIFRFISRKQNSIWDSGSLIKQN